MKIGSPKRGKAFRFLIYAARLAFTAYWFRIVHVTASSDKEPAIDEALSGEEEHYWLILRESERRMQMHYANIVLAIIFAVFLHGCVGVYYVSEKPAPLNDAIYLLKPNGADVTLGPAYQQGRDPHVAPDGSLFYAKPISGIYQIHRNGVQVTNSPNNKRNPVYRNGWLAYEEETSTGKKIGYKQMPGGPEIATPVDVSGGLAFFDNGQKIVFARDDGVYWAPFNPIGVGMRIMACGQTPPSGCGNPVVSHNGQMLAFVWYQGLAPGWIYNIEVRKIGTWDLIIRIPKGALCPSPGCPGTYVIETLGSLDFSPDDEWLYVTARVSGAAGSSSQSRQELFQIKVGGVNPERLLNNTIPDYHPATKLFYWLP